jgi:hypothetical protein
MKSSYFGARSPLTNATYETFTAFRAKVLIMSDQSKGPDGAERLCLFYSENIVPCRGERSALFIFIDTAGVTYASLSDCPSNGARVALPEKVQQARPPARVPSGVYKKTARE